MVVLLLSGFLAAAEPVAAQTSIQQRAYPVKHLSLDEATQQVRQLLSGDTNCVVFADQESNRLLVQAPADKLAQVGQLLGQVDRPAAPAQPAPTVAVEPYLKAYPVAPQQQAAAAEWAAKLQLPAGNRVAYDQHNNQLLVMGPDNLHRFVGQQLGTTGEPAPAAALPQVAANQEPTPAPQQPQPAQVAQPTVATGGTAMRLQLRTMNGEQLHQRLEQLLSRPLPATATNGDQRISFRAEMIPGAGVTLNVARDSGDLLLSGTPEQKRAWQSVLSAMDTPQTSQSSTHVVATKPKTEAQIREALQVVQASAGQRGTNRAQARMVNMLFQPQDESAPAEGDDAVAAVPFTGAGDEEGVEGADGALMGPVQIQFVEGLDIILIKGNKRDVERVKAIINRIEQVSLETVPKVEVVSLEHVESSAMARLLERVYTEVLGPRTGTLSITPLGKPNSLMLIGRPENVETALELVKQIDVPVEPTTRFEVFPLKFAVAGDVKQIIDAYITDQEQTFSSNPGSNNNQDDLPSLRPRALVVADFRTNSLFVNAGPRDMSEIATMIRKLDVNRGAAIDEVRVFPLRNTLAEDMADVLREAVLARDEGSAQEGGDATSARVSALQLMIIDPENQRKLESGVLANIRIAADSQANNLVITAPSESMELIAALIEQLDRVPEAEAEIKVFTIVNGDAVALTEMLQELFTSDNNSGDGPSMGAGDNSLVKLQFSVDERTNSIIAAGTQDNLAVVYAILLQLDASETRERRTEVYRLKNSPAEDVAEALNEWLQEKRDAEEAAELTMSPFEQIDREVIIVPELVNNSLIVSATDRYFKEIAQLIEQLDERPPMVMIQVLIAEVRLNDTDEFGVELGLQDSILFDRSVLDSFETIDTTTTTQSAGGATITTTQQNVINSPLSPGFNFNNQTPGNNGSTQALATAGTVATQGLSSFALNRVNQELGFGGFVFSASSNSVSTLLRALQENRRLEVLSRPQVSALDNQVATVSIGQSVPRIVGTSISEYGQQNSVSYEDVGIIMQVTPRVSPDGMVVMNIEATKSDVGSESEGIPIFAGTDGTVIRAPKIDQITATTTVAAASGQTVVLSGLLSKETLDVHRRVPILSEIPLLGDLFRYDGVTEQRSELLIIMTPRVIRNEEDAEMIKQVESARMSWVLGDVISMHGPSGLRSRCDDWSDADSVFPTQIPGDSELMPVPTEGDMYEPQEAEPQLQQPEQAYDVVIPESQSANSRTGSATVPVGYQQPTGPAIRRLPALGTP
ncbi:secretin N-terminal domain-containing protein [Aeoliella mucimassa]|uniref:secretin N-terminal domain-containing protein n=1 Tax=Aeoliella mucimassa TaxID=2527972 RepID=UPI0018D4371F|nr:secretin N-terminal domain-containing protein [Aeoliella mucimassa]